EIRRDDRASLGRHCGLLPAGEQGLARLRRGAQQQDPRHPTPRLRLARRGLPSPQNPDLHVACPIANSAFRLFLWFLLLNASKAPPARNSATQKRNIAMDMWTTQERCPTSPQRQQQKKTANQN